MILHQSILSTHLSQKYWEMSSVCLGLMGAKVVITGIQPAVAITLIELGIRIENVYSTRLENGLEKLERELED